MNKRKAVEALRRAGFDVKEIASLLGLTTQGVQYHIDRSESEKAQKKKTPVRAGNGGRAGRESA